MELANISSSKQEFKCSTALLTRWTSLSTRAFIQMTFWRMWAWDQHLILESPSALYLTPTICLSSIHLGFFFFTQSCLWFLESSRHGEWGSTLTGVWFGTRLPRKEAAAKRWAVALKEAFNLGSSSWELAPIQRGLLGRVNITQVWPHGAHARSNGRWNC